VSWKRIFKWESRENLGIEELWREEIREGRGQRRRRVSKGTSDEDISNE